MPLTAMGLCLSYARMEFTSGQTECWTGVFSFKARHARQGSLENFEDRAGVDDLLE